MVSRPSSSASSLPSAASSAGWLLPSSTANWGCCRPRCRPGARPGGDTSYDAGSKTDRHPGGGYRFDGEFLEAVSEAEDEVRERLREVQQLQERVAAALDAAREALAQARVALAAALAMPVKEKCGGCHGAREAAIAAAEAAIAGAEERIRICEAAADLLSPLAARLQQALDRLQQVPQDLGAQGKAAATVQRARSQGPTWMPSADHPHSR